MNKKFPMENPNTPFPEYLQYLIGQYKRLASEDSNFTLETESPYAATEFTEKMYRR